MASMERVKLALRNGLRSTAFQDLLVAVHVAEGAEVAAVEQPRGVYTSHVFNIEEFPYVELNGSISRNTRSDQEVIDLLHEVQLFWYERGDEEEALDAAVCRAMWAVRQYFEQNKFLFDIASAPLILGDDNYSPFVPAGPYEGRPFVKAGMTTIYVRTLG